MHAILALFILIYWIRELIKISDEKQWMRELLKDPEEKEINCPKEAQESLDRFYATWDVSILRVLMFREMEKFPQYEAWLSFAYNEQLELLLGIERESPTSIKLVKERLKKTIDQCHSNASLSLLQNQAGWILKIVPELAKAFETRRLKLLINKTNKTKRANKNLFKNCQSKDEVKRRFRRLAFLNHPDRGGDSKAMIEVIRQYEEAIKNI